MTAAVVLLSGGLDSTTAAALAREQGFELLALTIDYDQRHRVEIGAARAVAAMLAVSRQVVLEVDLRAFGGSALTADIAVPKGAGAPDPAIIPVTYVPARNTIFLSLALGFAEAAQARDIFVGVNALDYSGYPDCRPAFIAAFEELASLGTRAGVRGERIHIHTPLITKSKAAIVAEAARLGVDLALTWSCYDPVPSGATGEAATRHAATGYLHCGRCDSCRLRRQGFIDAAVPDPTAYVA